MKVNPLVKCPNIRLSQIKGPRPALVRPKPKACIARSLWGTIKDEERSDEDLMVVNKLRATPPTNLMAIVRGEEWAEFIGHQVGSNENMSIGDNGEDERKGVEEWNPL